MWSTWCAVDALAERATFEEFRFVVLNDLLVSQYSCATSSRVAVPYTYCLRKGHYRDTWIKRRVGSSGGGPGRCHAGTRRFLQLPACRTAPETRTPASPSPRSQLSFLQESIHFSFFPFSIFAYSSKLLPPWHTLQELLAQRGSLESHHSCPSSLSSPLSSSLCSASFLQETKYALRRRTSTLELSSVLIWELHTLVSRKLSPFFCVLSLADNFIPVFSEVERWKSLPTTRVTVSLHHGSPSPMKSGLLVTPLRTRPPITQRTPFSTRSD